MNEFQAYTASEIFFLFVGCAIAVFGILYKVAYIDESDVLKQLAADNEKEAEEAMKSGK